MMGLNAILRVGLTVDTSDVALFRSFQPSIEMS